ncbi:hypothetical protein H671_6g15799 [Cricetulus griseus]|nr:hypothetical protein H671_6g15799 [Cricetulus griseus]
MYYRHTLLGFVLDMEGKEKRAGVLTSHFVCHILFSDQWLDLDAQVCMGKQEPREKTQLARSGPLPFFPECLSNTLCFCDACIPAQMETHFFRTENMSAHKHS